MRDYGALELSADRAGAVRKILQDAGVPANQFFMVAERRTPSRCFRTIPISRPIAA